MGIAADVSEGGAAKTRRPLLVVLTVGLVLITTVIAVRSGVGRVAVNKEPAPAMSDRDRSLAPQAKDPSVSERCLDALHAVESSGHALRDDTEFRCPGIAAEPGGEHHWGATCWRTVLCPGGSYIAIDESLIGPEDARLSYVIAHEICHVNSYTRTGEAGSEPAADECAAAAGFPRE